MGACERPMKIVDVPEIGKISVYAKRTLDEFVCTCGLAMYYKPLNLLMLICHECHFGTGFYVAEDVQ